jgi:hypothetical protein
MPHDAITLTGPGGFSCPVSNASGYWLPANSPIITSQGLWVGVDQNLCLQSQTIATATAVTAPWALHTNAPAAAKSSLEILTITGGDWSSVIEATVSGVAGDSITLTSTADGSGAGSITRSGTAFTFHFETEVTTADDFDTAVGALTGADDLIGVKSSAGDPAYALTAATDAFAATNLAGGVDPDMVDAVLDDDAAVAPDGTSTADQVTFDNLSAINQAGGVWQPFTGTAVSWTASVWARTVTGTGTMYLTLTDGAAPGSAAITACALTTTWQRFTVTKTLTAATWYVEFGPDSNCDQDLQPTTQAALSCYLWGVQVQPGTIASPYHATVAAAFASANTVVSVPCRVNTTRPYCIGGIFNPARSWAPTGNQWLMSTGTPYGAVNSAYVYSAIGGDMVAVQFDNAGQYRRITRYWATAGAISAGTHTIVARFPPGASPSLYIDGVLQTATADGTGVIPTVAATTIYIANLTSQPPLNGYVKKLVQGNTIQEVLQELAKI